jgi:hypothetical protein
VAARFIHAVERLKNILRSTQIRPVYHAIAGVGAALDDFALNQHQHLVGVADGAEPVGNDKAGASRSVITRFTGNRFPLASH